MADSTGVSDIRKIAFVGEFLPRPVACAMPETWLWNAFASEFCDCETLWVAISDVRGKYAYPSRVRFEITQASPESYASAAEFLNLNDIDLVCFHYDFYIQEDEAAASLSLQSLLRELRVPVVFNLSAVPEAPVPSVRKAIALLAQFSTCLVVSSAADAETLRQVYSVPEDEIQVLEPPRTERIPGPEAPEWRVLSRQYMDCFRQARRASTQRALEEAVHPLDAPLSADVVTIPVTGAKASGPHDHALPVLKLDHFLRMTDETGILKGAVLSLPDYHQGYTTSDNARALVFSLLLEHVGEGPFIPTQMQITRYLAFLYNAFNAGQGRFRETMNYTRAWQDDVGSEECHGLAVWALGMMLGRSRNAGVQGVALRLFEAAIPAVKQFSSLRAWAFALLGIHEYLRRYSGDRSVRRTGKLLLDRLVQMYHSTASDDWPWFEDALGAGSICVSQALIAASDWVGEPGVVDLGLKTLRWLAELQFSEGHFIPIGDEGYYRRGGQRARFTQRPVEARGMISACLDAFRATGEEQWLKFARGAFQWFLGRNDLGQPLYDAETGACSDGLAPGRLDRNYSSEALLSFLLAQLEMRLFDQIYHQRKISSRQLPILQIGSPSQIILPEENHFSGLD